MADTYVGSANALSDPATNAASVTPHNTLELRLIPKAIYVGTGGDITMRGLAGTADQVWKAVPAGTVLPFRARYIRATGTTAADMLALY